MTTKFASVLSGVLTSAVSRGAAALAPIVTVPIALHALGATHYGAWSSALALTALAIFADLGLGAGLMTQLSASLAADDLPTARQLVSSAYAAVISVTVVLLAALWLSTLFVDWGALVGGAEGRGDSQVEAIVLVTYTAFLLNVAASLIVRVQYAAHQLGRSNLWQAAGTVAGVVAIFLAAQVGVAGAAFVAIASFVPPLAAVINTLTFFRTSRGRRIAPVARMVRVATARSLLRLGVGFLGITTLMAVSLSVDTWIVGRAMTLTDAAEYSVLARIFTVVGTLVSILSIPLWPHHAAALASGDHAWVVSTTRRMLVISPLVVAAGSIAAAVALPFVLPLWLGGTVVIPASAAWGFVAWNVVQGIAAPLFMVQNAAAVLRPQLAGYCLLLLVLPVKWWIATTHGYAWLPFVTVVGYTVFIIPAAAIGYRIAVARSDTPAVEVVRP